MSYVGVYPGYAGGNGKETPAVGAEERSRGAAYVAAKAGPDLVGIRVTDGCTEKDDWSVGVLNVAAYGPEARCGSDDKVTDV